MEFDKKFGNIDLYLYQLRCAVAREMASDCSANYFPILDEEYYRTSAVQTMTRFLAKRLSRRGSTQVLDKDSLCNALFRRDISFRASSQWKGDMETTNVCFDRLMIHIFRSGRQGMPVRLVFRPLARGHNIGIYKCSFDADDAIDLMLLVDSLHERIEALVHEEYTARLSRTRANRIRRIAARLRRHMQ